MKKIKTMALYLLGSILVGVVSGLVSILARDWVIKILDRK